MSTFAIEPIVQDWTNETNFLQLAQSICDQLAQYEISALPADLTPLLVDAADELVQQLGLNWTVSAADAPVALVRTIARAATINPAAGGPNGAALLAHLLS